MNLRNLALLIGLAVCSVQIAQATGNDPEIDYLLAQIRDSGCTFLRNGEAHDSAAAADHLAMKYRRGRRYVDSAEQFIERIASKSSWTGERYEVHCDGQESTAAGLWLSAALEDSRASRTGNG